MLPEWTVVGFSGHRKLADEKVVAAGIRNAFERLAAHHGPLATVSSAASGSDTLFLEEAARRALPYMIILPFSEERFKQDFGPAEWQRVQPLIEKATRIEGVAGEETEEGAYMEGGILTADRADVMLVVWDGKPSAGFGGTGDVVAYARESKKPLVIVDPDTGKISEENTRKLLGKPSAAAWKGNPRKTVETHFDEIDEIAKIHAPRSRHLVLRIVLFQLLASAIGLTALGFEDHESRSIINLLSTLAELVLLAIAFAATLEHRKRSDEWVKNRIAAEICRAFLAMWEMRRRPDYFPVLSIREFDRLCRNLRLIRVLDTTPPPSLESARDRYLKERVEDQLKFFSKKGALAREHFRQLKFLMLGSTAVATFCSLLTLVLLLIHKYTEMPGELVLPVKYASLLLPLASTAFFLLIVTQDYSRRAVRYAEMHEMLEDVKKRLQKVKTWNSLVRIAAETEERLLQEVIEWHSFRRFAGEPG